MVGTLMCAQILCGMFASIASSDTNRDIFFAQAIGAGRYFPMVGPEINHTLHLGPLWYYLLAPAAWFGNAAAVTALMGVISATQFPLAYILGRRFGSDRHAILFVGALALPGWITVSLASMTHTLLVVPACLFSVLATAAYRDHPSVGKAFLIGIGMALLVTAHPTTLPIAALLLVWAALRAPTGSGFVIQAVVAIGLPLLALAPMIYVEYRDHLGDIDTLAAYSNGGWRLPPPTSIPLELYAVVTYGPKYLLRFLLGLPGRMERFWFAVYAALMIVSFAGVALQARERGAPRNLIVTIVVVLCLQVYFTCAIRPVMPPWMVYVQWPLIAALVAIGLSRVCAYGNTARWLVSAMMGSLLALTLWSYKIFTDNDPNHSEIKPSAGKSGSFDIRDYEKSKYVYRLPRLRFTELFRLGEPLCEPTSLYGHYAYLVDYTFAVSAAFACGSVDQVEFGGPRTGRQELFALTKGAWHLALLVPERWIGSLGVIKLKQIWSSPVPLVPVLPRLDNFPRGLKPRTQDFVVEGVASADEAVAVASRAHRYLPFMVVGVTADGQPAATAYEVSRYFGFPTSTPCDWDGELADHDSRDERLCRCRYLRCDPPGCRVNRRLTAHSGYLMTTNACPRSDAQKQRRDRALNDFCPRSKCRPATC